MFIDEAVIHVKAGSGGRGCTSFRREKYIPKGGPDGGDGGRGGNVILAARGRVHTLLDVHSTKLYVAPNGEPGRNKDCSGKGGRDVVIEIPCGTVIKDVHGGVVLKDLTEDGDSVVIARGGRGGKGNKRFATSSNQAPTESEEGERGEERELELTLKLIADVGIVGMPNAGKSSLLARLSAATPKIAAYPFTTLSPVLGIVAPDEETRFVMADIPGLIEGAHKGVGLGDEFLRHVERSSVLLHIIDVAPPVGPSPAESYHIVRGELAAHSPALAAKPEIIAANKADLDPQGIRMAAMRQSIQRPIFPISTVTGAGLPALVARIVELLANLGGERSDHGT